MIETISILGANISLYYLFWLLGAVLVLIVGCYLGKGYEFSPYRSIIYITGAIALGYLLLWGTSWVFGGGKMNGLNYVRIVIFMPIPVFILTRLLRDSFAKLADMVAPLLAIFHGVTHIGCIFPGCCHGYPAQRGLYSNAAGTICFPIQPIETISSLLIAAVLLLLWKKKLQQGKLYMWYLILFGTTRFVWEFFRDHEKVWNGVSELGLHALSAVIVGFVTYIAVALISKKEHEHEKC